MARYSIVKRQRKYYKYADWSQTVNPAGITSTSGWGNVANAFDGDNNTYATCGTRTDYIEWDLGANIILTGITAVGQFVSAAAECCNIIVKSVNEKGVEVVLGKTTGASHSSNYQLSVTFGETIVNKLRFYLTDGDSSGQAPNTATKTRIREITLKADKQVFDGTIEDYDYYVDKNKLYQLAANKRSYYKYEDWTQPSLTANGTLGGDSFAVAASVEHNGTWGDWRAYHAFNGDLSDNGWSGSTNTLPQHVIFYNPKKLLVSNIRILNHEGKDGGYTAGNIYGSNDGSDWTLIAPFTNDVITKGLAWDIALPSNRTLYKYHKIEITATQGFSSTNQVKCKEIYITAKTSSKSTKADYDYYTDRDVAYDLVYKPFEVISQTFNVSDELQTYVVPEGVNKVSVVCTASKGAGNAGGGGSVKCDLSVAEGQTLYVMVGASPTAVNTPVYNASDIRINGTEYENRIIVAGGGGTGTGTTSGNLYHDKGGAGGGLIGGDAKAVAYQKGGFGGTQEAGGAASYRSGGATDGWVAGAAGTLGMGGKGAKGSMYGSTVLGGAGGAGYYGGGGGGVYDINDVGISFAGGGGGSSYTDDTLCSNVVHLQGINNGEGYVKISYIKELKQ